MLEELKGTFKLIFSVHNSWQTCKKNLENLFYHLQYKFLYVELNFQNLTVKTSYRRSYKHDFTAFVGTYLIDLSEDCREVAKLFLLTLSVAILVLSHVTITIIDIYSLYCINCQLCRFIFKVHSSSIVYTATNIIMCSLNIVSFEDF